MTKVALVTGASRGIGAEVTRQLASDLGYVVFAGARDPDDVEEADGIVPIELDVTDQGEVDDAQERIGSEVGHLDALVNNAGVYGDPVGAADYDLERAHEVLEVNTFGPWRLIEAFLPLLRRSDAPRIVNVSSGAGQLADMNGGRGAYRVSKAALNALTRTLAWDERDVKINVMCPGWVRTDMGGSGASRSVEEGADTAVWLATLPDDGPTGGFFRDRKPIPW
ncbi:MAG TPA: SDR family oxidoreductase [Solirubrobacterales bacterium]|nr:SDR family oxidoreductase [Solirubrobacterales bacterium]